MSSWQLGKEAGCLGGVSMGGAQPFDSKSKLEQLKGASKWG